MLLLARGYAFVEQHLWHVAFSLSLSVCVCVSSCHIFWMPSLSTPCGTHVGGSAGESHRRKVQHSYDFVFRNTNKKKKNTETQAAGIQRSARSTRMSSNAFLVGTNNSRRLVGLPTLLGIACLFYVRVRSLPHSIPRSLPLHGLYCCEAESPPAERNESTAVTLGPLSQFSPVFICY